MMMMIIIISCDITNDDVTFVYASPVTISLFPTSIDLDPMFENNCDRFFLAPKIWTVYRPN